MTPIKIAVFIFLILWLAAPAFSLEPENILIIANSDIAASVEIAQYYRDKRNIPAKNILELPLGKILSDKITRENYKKLLVEPVRRELYTRELTNGIKCLLTVYGVPIKVGRREPLEDQQEKLSQLEKQAEENKNLIKQLEQNTASDSVAEIEDIKSKLTLLQSEIDFITGKETDASVDSELSMVLFENYELYRWQQNKLQGNLLGLTFNTLMVSRLDGPGVEIIKGLIDKAIAAEKTGLKGFAYFDSRGITDDKKPYSPGYFDQSLRDLATITKFRTELTVKQELTESLFLPGTCPQTAVYCGWYSLEKYIDAFDFVDGAVGYHISSLEAVDLRDPNSSQWCPAMLKDGITATLGAVAEPYLHAFPEPRKFFTELYNGKCLVETYYHTKPFNSWQLVLVGDPLYTPFKKY